MENSAKTMDQIVALCKNRGFVYPGSEIYGGLANSWDYGPLGVEFKNNVKKAWWKKFVQESKYNVGLDSAILMNPQTWVTSGHVGGFSDPLMDCRDCHARHRADKLIEDAGGHAEGMSFDEMTAYIREHGIACPECGSKNFTDIRKFNLMFKTFMGVTEDAKNEVYLRPETAQGIFVNYANIQRTTRRKLPFGVCQIGKSFRNEITPGNFIFRIREFEQMECEFFCKPDTDLDWFYYWKDYCKNFLLSLGMKEENMRLRDHEKEELSFYSKATTDIEYLFPFGWGELWGIADRTNYDLGRHQEASGKSLEYFDPETNERYIPYVVEPSLGADRVALAFLCEAYDEEVSGPSAPTIVEYLKERGVRPAMVVDEGGAVVDGVFPGVKQPIAVVGIGEKGFMNVELTARAAGGHASTPAVPSTLGMLCRAVADCEKHQFKAHLTAPVRALFQNVGPYAPFGLRLVFANLWLFGPLLPLLAGRLGGELGAMMRTTMALTTAQGSKQINVLPTEASAGVNLRLVNLDTPESAAQHLKDVIRNDKVEVKVTYAQNASPYASAEDANWETLAKAVGDTWQGSIVSPYLMMACSDSRHFSAICRDVYKFSAMALSKEQRGLIHNNDERIPVREIAKTVEFFTRLEQSI